MNKEASISIIVPMYNEAENVESLLQEIHSTLQGHLDFEILAIDDGSSDETYTQLAKLKASMPELIVLKHKKNAGQSVAIVTGARAAKNEWLVTMDGDGQNNPADILKLYQLLIEKKTHITVPLVLLGNRRTRHDTTFRRLSSRIANKVRSGLLKDNCPDTGCSLKLFPKNLFLELPHFNHVHRFLPALFKRSGAEIVNVPVDHRARTKGVSKYGLHNRLWVGIIDLFGVLWLLKRPCQVEVTNGSE